MILSPYATHMNLASAPVINKFEYPVILSTSASAKLYELAPSMPNAFWWLVQPKEATQPISAAIAGLKKEGKIKGRVATIHPTVQLGVELHSCVPRGRKEGRARGRVQQELSVRSFGPAAATARSDGHNARRVHRLQLSAGHVHDHRAGCRSSGFNPQIMYLAIGTPFPGFKAKFGNKVNGILLYGGLDPGAAGPRRLLQGAPGHVQPRVGSGRGRRLRPPSRRRSRPSRQSAKSIARRSATRSPTARSRRSGARSSSRTSSTSILGLSASGRTAKSSDCIPANKSGATEAPIPEAGLVVIDSRE